MQVEGLAPWRTHDMAQAALMHRDLQRGDVLVEVDGHTIRTPDDFTRITVATGSRIAMTVRRGKTRQTITIGPAVTGGTSR